MLATSALALNTREKKIPKYGRGLKLRSICSHREKVTKRTIKTYPRVGNRLK